MSKILLKFGVNVKGEYALDYKGTTIGRASGNDIVIDNLGVSKSHARIFHDGHCWVIEDLASSNGTFVNGNRIKEPQSLGAGDQIRILKHTLEFIRVLEFSPDDQVSPHDAPPILTDNQETVFVSPVPQGFPNQKAGSKQTFLEVSSSGKRLKSRRERFEIYEGRFTIGTHRTADVQIYGWLLPGLSAQIKKMKSGYKLIPYTSIGASIRLNGDKIKIPQTLLPEDEFSIRSFKFIFKSADNQDH